LDSAARRLGAASLVAAFITSFATAGATSAEVKKLMSTCPGQKLCAWYQSTVTPPKGWLEDKDDLDFNDPMIYVQTSFEPGTDTLDAIVAVNQAQWRKQEPKGTITPAGTAPRASGTAPFELFLYQNPFKPKQAFETIAYGFAIQPNGDRYFLTIVDTAASKTAIDASSDDFLAVLKGL
jgi:hypothetical protein